MTQSNQCSSPLVHGVDADLPGKRKLDTPVDCEYNDIDGSEIGEDDDEQVLQDEYRLWKKNTPFLYDTVLTHCLTWPSLTCQWLPDRSEPVGSDYAVSKLVLGTQTSDGSGNALLIASVKLPKEGDEIDVDKYEESAQEGNERRIQITTQICHPGEVNKARYCPANSFLIATKTVAGDVLLFDYSKHPSKPRKEDEVNSQARFLGHAAEGFALDWQKCPTNCLLASGAQDGIICIWGIPDNGGDVDPLVTFNGHQNASVEAVTWNFYQHNNLMSVGDDRRIIMWDIRNGKNPVNTKLDAHDGDINSITTSPHTEFLFATCSSDKTIKLWDTRRLDREIYTLAGCHSGEVTDVTWSNFSEHMVTSSGNDRRVVLWDLSRIGGELTSEEASDGPPELVFIHCGHTGRVTDFAPDPNDQHTIASTADDNILQIWKINSSVYSTDSDDEEAV